MSSPFSDAGYYELVNGKSSKFYECLMDHDGTYVISWGKIGTKGQSKKGNDYWYAYDKIREKKKKGYVAIDLSIKTVKEKELKKCENIKTILEEGMKEENKNYEQTNNSKDIVLSTTKKTRI